MTQLLTEAERDPQKHMTMASYDCGDVAVAETVARRLRRASWADVSTSGSVVSFATSNYFAVSATARVALVADRVREQIAGAL